MQALFAAFGLNGSLILAQAVNFGILLIALTYFLYKPINKVLATRQAKIAQGVQDAERAAEKLASADSVASEKVSHAENEAEGIVLSARETASAEKARILKEAEARAANVAADAEVRAQEASAKMLRESEKEVARLAVLAAEKIMQKSHA
jgi:F-type H+-transporting ATPase subunit b